MNKQFAEVGKKIEGGSMSDFVNPPGAVYRCSYP